MNLSTRSGTRCARPVVFAALLVAALGCGRENPSPRAGSGRARLVTLPSGGEGAEYVYDAGGNILQIRPAVAVGVSVADFVPRQGGIGQIVTVFGAGFSPTPSLNEVRVNGVTATVLAATSSELTFTVPSGATTGRIAVTSGGSTGTSADDFTVVPGVVVSDFTPKLGKVGTVLTVQGFNFDPIQKNVQHQSLFIQREPIPVINSRAVLVAQF